MRSVLAHAALVNLKVHEELVFATLARVRSHLDLPSGLGESRTDPCNPEHDRFTEKPPCPL